VKSGHAVFGRPFVKRFALCYRSVVCPVCLSVCNVGVLWPNGWGIKMKFGMQVGLGPGHTVLDGDPVPLLQRGTAPQFSAHICCGQMAAWIKMSLGTKLGLGQGDFVLDGYHAPPPQKGAEPPPFFGPCLLRRNDWMDEAGTWHGGRLQPRQLCVRWGPRSLSPKGGQSTPKFSAHVYCGQTAG